jgi:hypothetical protein
MLSANMKADCIVSNWCLITEIQNWKESNDSFAWNRPYESRKGSFDVGSYRCKYRSCEKASHRFQSASIVILINTPGFVAPQEDMYGLGAARTPEKFYEVFGIDVTKKKTERHLCRFVESGQMHNQFTKLIRRDGMGVDYSKINYKFKDPAPNEKD